MINLLGLALYGPLAASHRVRLSQYKEGLLEKGINMKMHSFLGDEYLMRRFSGRRPQIIPVLNAGIERAKLLTSKNRFDAVIVHCELFPLAPAFLERAALRIPYIYDFDDAWYLRYKHGKLSKLRYLLGNKFEKFMRGASAITAGSGVLAEYARKFNPNVSILPSVVDVKYYYPDALKGDRIFTVGWIGSPSTAPYLHRLVRPLEALGLEKPLRLVIIGGRAPPISNVEVVEIPWSSDKEVSMIREFDVGVMPLPDDEWARGKCAFKLVQYMACGIPVVASPVGANIELVIESCGFLAEEDSHWINALRRLRDNHFLRIQMGMASRERVVESYSVQRNLPLLVDVIKKVVNAS